MTPSAELHVLEDEISLANEVADFLAWTAHRAVRDDTPYRLVLSGGSTPRTLYRTLTRQEWAARFPWPRIRFFFGDERCVPPAHPESNYAMAKTALFDPLGIPDHQVTRMRGEDDPDLAATNYEHAIRQAFSGDPSHTPSFDVVLLGLGDDGHTASLFPGSPALEERDRLVVPTQSPVGIPYRLTLTLPVLTRAKVALFIVTGQKKASVVSTILDGTGGTGPMLPAARIQPTDGRLIWYLDEGAASALKTRYQRVPHHEE